MRPGEFFPAVAPEARNPPAASDLERNTREYKIPDFRWGYVDAQADDPNDGAKQFFVECKRLTQPQNHYAREYVVSGIERFRSPGHAYGKDMPKGAMIGYLQDISFNDAVRLVNKTTTAKSITPLTLVERDSSDGAVFQHDFDRPFPMSPFVLVHIWARMGVHARPKTESLRATSPTARPQTFVSRSWRFLRRVLATVRPRKRGAAIDLGR